MTKHTPRMTDDAQIASERRQRRVARRAMGPRERETQHPRKPKDLIPKSLAIHEAGHAVMFILYGISFEYIAVRSRRQARLGISPPGGKLEPGFRGVVRGGPDPGDPHTAGHEGAHVVSYYHRHLVISMAGPMAEEKITKGKPPRPFLIREKHDNNISMDEYDNDDLVIMRGDDVNVIELVSHLVRVAARHPALDRVSFDWDDVGAEFERKARRDTWAILGDPQVWQAIEALAGVLQEQLVVQYDEALAIVGAVLRC